MDRHCALTRWFLVAVLGAASLVAHGQSHAATYAEAMATAQANCTVVVNNGGPQCTHTFHTTNPARIYCDRYWSPANGQTAGYKGHGQGLYTQCQGFASEDYWSFTGPASMCVAGSDSKAGAITAPLSASGKFCGSTTGCEYQASGVTIQMGSGADLRTAGTFAQTGQTCTPSSGVGITSPAPSSYCINNGGGYSTCREGNNVCVNTPKGNKFCWSSGITSSQADHPDLEGAGQGAPPPKPAEQPDATPYAEVGPPTPVQFYPGPVLQVQAYDADPDRDGDGQDDDDEEPDCPANNPDCEEEDDEESVVGDSPCGAAAAPQCDPAGGDVVSCAIYLKAWRIACEQEHSNKLLASLERTLDAEAEETNAKLAALKDANEARMREIKAAVEEGTDATNNVALKIEDVEAAVQEVKSSTNQVKTSTDAVKTAVDEAKASANTKADAQKTATDAVADAVDSAADRADMIASDQLSALNGIDFSIDEVADAIDGWTQNTDSEKLDAIRAAIESHMAQDEDLNQADRDYIDQMTDLDGVDFAGPGQEQIGLEEAATNVEEWVFGPDDVDMGGFLGSSACPAFPVQSIGGMPWSLPDDFWCDFLGLMRIINSLLAAWWAAQILMRV